MDNAEFIEGQIVHNEIKPLINIDDILAPEPNEEQMEPSQVAIKTLDRLTPYISPLISAEEITSAKATSSNKDEAYIRKHLAEQIGDNLGWLGVFAPEPATFDEKAFIAASQYPNTRPLEVAVKLGLIIKGVDGRFMLPKKSKELFIRLLT